MVRPSFGPGLYGCCGARKPAGERQNYCPSCKKAYMAEWRAARHKPGDPSYERHLRRCRAAGRAKTRERREDRAWRSRRARIAIARLNAAGVDCRAIREALGVAEMTVYHWRNGTRTPLAANAARLFRLADAVLDATP